MPDSAQPPRLERPLFAVRNRVPLPARVRMRRLLVGGMSRLPAAPLEGLRSIHDRAIVRGNRNRLVEAALMVCSYRPIPNNVDSFHPPGRPDLRFAPFDDGHVRRVYWLGLDRAESVTRSELEVWTALCRRATSVLEIGAHIGLFTVVGARACPGPYPAAEPHPDSARVHRQNLDLNGLSSVRLIEAAAVGTDSVTSVRLVIPLADQNMAPAGAQIDRVPESMRVAGRAQLDVDAVDVRSLVTDQDLLKFDVEGAEQELLEAIESYLLSQKPVVMIEVLPGADGLRRFIASLVTRAGYRGWAMTSAGLREVDPTALTPATLADCGTWDMVLATTDPAA